MSDLQCPATVVFVPASPSTDDAAYAAALPTDRFRVAAVRRWPAAAFASASAVTAQLEALADEFRGECVVVPAPVDTVRRLLGVPGVSVSGDGPARWSATERLPGSAAPNGPDPGRSETNSRYLALDVDADGVRLRD